MAHFRQAFFAGPCLILTCPQKLPDKQKKLEVSDDDNTLLNGAEKKEETLYFYQIIFIMCPNFYPFLSLILGERKKVWDASEFFLFFSG